MRAIEIPAGAVFGRLAAIEPARTAAGRRAMLCRCECGQMTTVDIAKLRSGHTRSCGCLHREVAAELARTNPLITEHRASPENQERMRQLGTTHGLSHHAHRPRWLNMMNRCHNPDNHAFPLYGGRGIRVFPEWHDLAAFCAWIDANLGPCPDGMNLDRIDNDGDYEPGNVRWATWAEQIHNSRSAKLTMSAAADIRARHAAGEGRRALAAEYGVSVGAIHLVINGKTWRMLSIAGS